MPDANLIKAESNYPKVLYTGQLAATDTAIYQCPPSSSVVIATATLCNTSAEDRLVSLSVVKTGQSAGATNRIMQTPAHDPLRAGDSFIVEELVGVMLGPGDFIAGSAAAAAAVTIVLTGAVSS